MPYIKEEKRTQYKFLLQMLDNTIISDPADLSFLITQLMKRYMKREHPMCWKIYSDILKAVDAAREAFMEDVYRPYEREKRKENGDVF